jgi:hypothetical protein
MRRRNPFKKYFDPYEYVVFAVKVHQDPYHSHPILANKPEVHEQAVQDAMEDGLIIEMDDGWKLTPAGVIHRTQREWALERAYAEETTLGERPPRLPGETHGQYMRRVELLEMGEEVEGSGYREAVGIEEVRALENPKLRRTRRKGRRRVAGGRLPPKGVLKRAIERRPARRAALANPARFRRRDYRRSEEDDWRINVQPYMHETEESVEIYDGDGNVIGWSIRGRYE